MTRLGRDSTTAQDIPVAGTQVAMGYANGTWMWTPQDWDRFPNIPHCLIDVRATQWGADVLDIETGDATIDQAPAWTRTHNEAPGAYPAILYCNRSTMPALISAMAGAGLHLAHDYRIFLATLDGTKSIADMTGIWGVQYAGAAQTGGHYDESLVYDDMWKPFHHAAPAPPGLWNSAVMTGTGLDGRLWHTFYDAATGVWSAPVRAV